MIVLAWNCCGMGACGFGNLIKDICKEYETSILFLFETHASKEEGVERILPKLGFDSSFIQPAHGHLGGTNKNRRLFRFIVVWLTHAQFDPFIKEFWCKELNWDDRLRDFRVELRRWNKEVFGNIFAWKLKLWWLLVVCFEISRRLDFCSVLEAKLWGIMYDLQMAAEAKMEHLHVAIDSLRAMMLIYDCMQFEGHNIASLLESEVKFQKLHLWPYWEK
ncbi:hypothetical protein JHK84_050776 [Glycine max]|nr:hypothetical protein JHK84_050776 [Glycine max]